MLYTVQSGLSPKYSTEWSRSNRKSQAQQPSSSCAAAKLAATRARDDSARMPLLPRRSSRGRRQLRGVCVRPNPEPRTHPAPWRCPRSASCTPVGDQAGCGCFRCYMYSCTRFNSCAPTGALWVDQCCMDPVLFHNCSVQNPVAGRDQGCAGESEFLLPQKHAPLPKNVNRLKSVPAGSQICKSFKMQKCQDLRIRRKAIRL
eukprot:COSAG01_NODE_1423_length_10356_cov_30.529590_6_plen_202_part_00